MPMTPAVLAVVAAVEAQHQKASPLPWEVERDFLIVGKDRLAVKRAGVLIDWICAMQLPNSPNFRNDAEYLVTACSGAPLLAQAVRQLGEENAKLLRRWQYLVEPHDLACAVRNADDECDATGEKPECCCVTDAARLHRLTRENRRLAASHDETTQDLNRADLVVDELRSEVTRLTAELAAVRHLSPDERALVEIWRDNQQAHVALPPDVERMRKDLEAARARDLSHRAMIAYAIATAALNALTTCATEERRRCAADVCIYCRQSQPVQRMPDQRWWHLDLYLCNAARMHERVFQATAAEEKAHG